MLGCLSSDSVVRQRLLTPKVGRCCSFMYSCLALLLTSVHVEVVLI
jgi:hypothetical protein